MKRRIQLKETDHRIDMGTFERAYFVGMINGDGEVLASQTAYDHKILLTWGKIYGFAANDKKWRMDKDDNIVRWWEHPTKIEKNLVAEFLNKWYHIRVRGHMDYEWPTKPQMEENISYNKNSGLIGVVKVK